MENSLHEFEETSTCIFILQFLGDEGKPLTLSTLQRALPSVVLIYKQK